MLSRTLSDVLQVERADDAAVVRLKVRHVAGEPVLRKLARELRGVLKRDGYTRLLLDFAEVDYLSSGLIPTLLHLQERAEAKGGKLALFNLRRSIAAVLRLAGFHETLCICQDEARARAAVEPKPVVAELAIVR